MLSADSNLEIFPCLAASLHSHAHESANSLSVNADKGIFRKNSVQHVAGQKLPCIIPRQTQTGLRQIIGSKGEKLRFPGYLVGYQAGPRQFDHGPNEMSDFDTIAFHRFPGYALDYLTLRVQLLAGTH